MTFSPAKKRIFLIVTLTIPLLFLVLLEAGLQVSHYGPDLSLFTPDTILGRQYWRMNPEVKARYFTRFAFTPTTSFDYFAIPKQPGVFRIFCLGGSTTVGYPYWYNGAFSSFLRDRLSKIFPEKKFEIINVGMTATNSFTVNDMARELVEYEPNLLIVYDGHNEFYGALGAASNESVGHSRLLNKVYLRLIHYRTFLLLRDITTGILNFVHPSASPRAPSTMMEHLARGQYIPYGSKSYQSGLEDFCENLTELRTMSEQMGIPLILSSQVSNLRDQPPFVSENTENERTPQQKLAAQQKERANKYLKEGKLDSARIYFQHSLDNDSLRADTHYLLAKCFDAAGEKASARREYIKARDYDQLRFRASSEMNAIIRSVCNDSNVIFVDMEKLFREYSPDSIEGKTLLVEHLHPNSRGYFLMGKALAETMRQHAFLAAIEEWNRCDTLPDDVYWNYRNITTIDERIAMRRTDVLTAGWPFKDQVPIVDPVNTKDTLGQIAEMVTHAQMDWREAHLAAADYYTARRDTANLEREFRVLINQLPFEIKSYLQLAHLLLGQGQLEEVRDILLKSLGVTKTILAYRALGDIAMHRGKPAEAISYYENTFIFNQSPHERIENGYLLALAYFQAGKQDESKAQLLKVLKINPAYQAAVELLAKINTSR